MMESHPHGNAIQEQSSTDWREREANRADWSRVKPNNPRNHSVTTDASGVPGSTWRWAGWPSIYVVPLFHLSESMYNRW